MAVVKTKDMDWKDYLRKLAESVPNKISDFELMEFAGYLLRRDMESSNDRVEIFEAIMGYDNCLLADMLASYLIAESPDSSEDLLNIYKNAVLEYYQKEITYLIKSEKEAIKQERAERKPEPDGEPDPEIENYWMEKQ